MISLMKKNIGDIFVSIACYRDPEVIPTVRDAYNKAKNKENIIFGVYAQMGEEDEELSEDYSGDLVEGGGKMKKKEGDKEEEKVGRT